MASPCGQWMSAGGMVYYTISGTTCTKATCLLANSTLITVTGASACNPRTPIPLLSTVTTTAVATLIEKQ